MLRSRITKYLKRSAQRLWQKYFVRRFNTRVLCLSRTYITCEQSYIILRRRTILYTEAFTKVSASMVNVTQVIQMNLNGLIGQAGKGMKQEPQEQGRDNSNDFRINIFRLGRN